MACWEESFDEVVCCETWAHRKPREKRKSEISVGWGDCYHSKLNSWRRTLCMDAAVWHQPLFSTNEPSVNPSVCPLLSTIRLSVDRSVAPKSPSVGILHAAVVPAMPARNRMFVTARALSQLVNLFAVVSRNDLLLHQSGVKLTLLVTMVSFCQVLWCYCCCLPASLRFMMYFILLLIQAVYTDWFSSCMIASTKETNLNNTISYYWLHAVGQWGGAVASR